MCGLQRHSMSFDPIHKLSIVHDRLWASQDMMIISTAHNHLWDSQRKISIADMKNQEAKHRRYPLDETVKVGSTTTRIIWKSNFGNLLSSHLNLHSRTHSTRPVQKHRAATPATVLQQETCIHSSNIPNSATRSPHLSWDAID